MFLVLVSRSDLESSIMYNLALSLVAGGNIAEAFSTLVAVEGYQSHSPFYWMRLGILSFRPFISVFPS